MHGLFRREQTPYTQLNCFSPPVMIATFVIEIVLVVYTVWRYKLDVLSRLITATLFFLGLFQLSEYFVCGGAGLSASTWSRTGYVAITMLPPLGLHILHVIAKRPARNLVATAYATGAGFAGYFLAYSQAFTGYQCTGNYVIFQLAETTMLAHRVYYFGWLAIALLLGGYWLRKRADLSAAQRQSIWGMIAGYLVFIVPATVVVTIKPEAMSGIPSIMCGFAVLFALILVFYISPRLGKRRSAESRS